MDYENGRRNFKLKAKDDPIRKHIQESLDRAIARGLQVPGINPIENRIAFVEQMVESVRRVQFIQAIRQKPTSPNRSNPASSYFDPIRAAIFHQLNGNIEEAAWLVFLATHFGKALRSGWLLTRSVYGALDTGLTWNWHRVSFNPEAFSNWLAENQEKLTSNGRRFGNHRKYESLNPASKDWTGEIIESYVNWILSYGSHQRLFDEALQKNNNDPRAAFRYLYNSMSAVRRFGRTAKFDYLTMIGKTRISDIIADAAYLSEATGPLKGARLLFGGTTTARISAATLENFLRLIDQELNVGMQVLEDSLCNWQKSPNSFKKFRG